MEVNLHYCDKKCGHSSRCGSVAAYLSKDDKGITHKRCEEHKTSKTVNRRIMEHVPFDQKLSLEKVNEFLRGYIEKPVYSKRERNSHPFQGKYLKSNGGIMCLGGIKMNQWKFVYYHQIINEPYKKPNENN